MPGHISEILKNGILGLLEEASVVRLETSHVCAVDRISTKKVQLSDRKVALDFEDQVFNAS